MDVASVQRAAREADATMRRGRRMLVDVIRAAQASGMSQREIATAVGRSQPEVNRLLRFHGDSDAGLALRRARPAVIKILGSYGLRNPRVFGSLARGEEGPTSDIDLLVTADQPPGLLALARAERDLSVLLGRDVDLVLDDGIRPDLADRILATAVRL